MFSSLLFTISSVLSLTAATPLHPQGAKPYLAEYVTFDHEDVIAGDYIIHFHEGHTLDRHYATIGRNFSDLGRHSFSDHAWLPGYRAKLDNTTLHEVVRRDPGVKLVEHNLRVHLDRPVEHPEFRDQMINNGTGARLGKRTFSLGVTEYWQPGPRMVSYPDRFGKDRFDSTLVQQGDYYHLAEAGKGVRIYVLDTGIYIGHSVFQGRALNFNGWTRSPYTDEPMQDNNGHGTHVAGVAGGDMVGVAPYATLVNVKVFNDSGEANVNAVAYGVQDVIQEHLSFRNSTHRPLGWRGSVINFSGSTSVPNLFYKTVWSNAYKAGIPSAVSAGNNNVDASSRYPCAYYGTTICVGATQLNYLKWPSSNYGSKLFVTAPGANVTSADNFNPYGLRMLSGTSQAAPHVAGAIAIWMGWEAFVNDADRAFNLIKWNGRSKWMAGWINTNTIDRFLNTGILLSHAGGPYRDAPSSPVGDPGSVNNPALDAINDIGAAAAWAVIAALPAKFTSDVPATTATNVEGATATTTVPPITETTVASAINSDDDLSVTGTSDLFSFSPTTTAA